MVDDDRPCPPHAPEDDPDLLRDLADVEHQSADEQVRRLNGLAQKYPRAPLLTEALARAAWTAGDDAASLAAISRTLELAGWPNKRQLDRLHFIAQGLRDAARRIAAYRMLLRASPDHVPSRERLTMELALAGQIVDAREVARQGQIRHGTFWRTLTPTTRHLLQPKPPGDGATVGGAGEQRADLPRFPHRELTIVRELIDTPERVMYEAVGADGRLCTVRTLPAVDPAHLHRTFLDIQVDRRTHPLIVRQLRVTRSSAGAPYQVLERVAGVTFAQLYPAPTRQFDALFQLGWTIARALIALHDRGFVLGFSADDVVVIDQAAAAPVMFLDNGMSASRAAGHTPLSSADPFPFTHQILDQERFRDVYLAVSLIHRAVAGTAPPYPWREDQLGNLPPGRAGAELLALFRKYLAEPAGPQGLTARDLAKDLDTIYTEEPRELFAGDRVGEWRLDHLLAEGGFAQIWRASGDDGSVVALKILTPEMQRSRTARFAFAQEARIMPRHPSFPVVLASGGCETDADLAWLAMERLTGETLTQALARGPFGLARTVEVGHQLAAALDDLHRTGYTHCDLKADNVYLETRPSPGARERVKILDLGSARSMTGELLGFAEHMFSEQAAARELWFDAPPTPAADGYALGLLLYQMKTGRLPYDCATTEEWRNCQANEPVGSHPLLDEHRGLAELVAAVTVKDARQRPSLAEVKARLEAIGAELGLPFALRTRRHAVDDPTPIAIAVRAPARGTPLSVPVVIEPPPPPPVIVAPPPVPPPVPVVPARRRSSLPLMIAASLVMVAGGAFYYARSGAAAPSCRVQAVADAPSLHREVTRLLRNRCTEAAGKAVDRLDDPSIDWQLDPRARVAWAAQLRLAIQEVSP